MSIPEDHANLVQALREAFAEGKVVLMPCRYVTTKEPVTVIAMRFEQEGRQIIAPVAKMFDGDPTEEVEPILGNDDEAAL